MIARVFFDQDMRLGLPGLNALIESKKIFTKKSDALVFVNTKKTMMKCLIERQYLLTVKAKEGRVSVDDILRIPSLFEGVWMNAKVKSQLENQLDVEISQSKVS